MVEADFVEGVGDLEDALDFVGLDQGGEDGAEGDGEVVGAGEDGGGGEDGAEVVWRGVLADVGWGSDDGLELRCLHGVESLDFACSSAGIDLR